MPPASATILPAKPAVLGEEPSKLGTVIIRPMIAPTAKTRPIILGINSKSTIVYSPLCLFLNGSFSTSEKKHGKLCPMKVTELFSIGYFQHRHRLHNLENRTISGLSYKICSILYLKPLNIFTALYRIDPINSLKAEIMAIQFIFMGQSIQVYQFFTTRNSADIHAICDKIIKSQPDKKYPRFVNVTNNNSHVSGSLKIETGATYNYEILHYEFIIKPKENMLILLGRSGPARNDVNDFLSQSIENDVRYKVIKSITISNGHMLQMFENIVTQHGDNIILELKTEYDPLQGIRVEKEVFSKISYSFTENRCASKHKQFDELIKESENIEMTFGLLRCIGLYNTLEPERHKLMAKSRNASFRVYKDVPLSDWNTFVDGILTFL